MGGREVWNHHRFILTVAMALALLAMGSRWYGMGVQNVGNRYLTRALMMSVPGDLEALWQRGEVPACPERGTCESARYWLDQAVQRNGFQGTIAYHLGLAEAMLGNAQAAQQAWSAAQEDGLASQMAYFWLGHSLAQGGEREAARQWWRRAAAGPWLLRQALAQARAGEAERALALVEDALAVAPSLAKEAAGDVAEVYRLVGDMFARQGEWQKAARFYGRAVQYAPQRVNGYVNLGNAYLNLHEYEAAIAAYDKAVTLQPTNGDVRLRLAEAYRRAGMFDRAEAEARRVTELDAVGWQVRAYEFLGRLYEQTRRPEQAETAYRQAIALNNTPSHLHIRLAALLVRQKRFGEAEVVLREVIEDGNPGLQAWAWQTLGWSYEVQQQWEAAEQAYREALALADNRDDYRLMLARVLRRLERFPEAEAVYRQATESDNPGWRGQAWFELGTLYEQQQQWEAAEAAYRQALAAAPQRDDYRIRLAEFLQRRQRPREAETLLRQATESRNPGWRAQAWFSLGNLYWSQQRWTEAVAAYEAAVEANPNNAGYWRRLADVYEQRGMPEKAEEARRKAQ